MTTFIDSRAAALGIVGILTTDQRIALDRNAQIEKHQLALVRAAAALEALAITPIEQSILNVTLERTQLDTAWARHYYTTQGMDLTNIPTVLPAPPPPPVQGA